MTAKKKKTGKKKAAPRKRKPAAKKIAAEASRDDWPITLEHKQVAVETTAAQMRSSDGRTACHAVRSLILMDERNQKSRELRMADEEIAALRAEMAELKAAGSATQIGSALSLSH